MKKDIVNRLAIAGVVASTGFAGCTLNGAKEAPEVPTMTASSTLEPRIITATFLPTDLPTATSTLTATPTSTETATQIPTSTETPTPTVITPNAVVEITPTQSAAICSPDMNDIPKEGQTVEIEGVMYTIKGVFKANLPDSQSCQKGLQIILDLCPCSQVGKTETPVVTPTLPFAYMTQTPSTGKTETPPPSKKTPTAVPTNPDNIPTATPGQGDSDGNEGGGKKRVTQVP